MVSPEIQKQNTHLREAIPPEQRLSVTLRYLATGESRRSLGFQYRISHNLISKIIPEVSSAIFTSLKQNYLKLPTTKEEWFAVAHDFHSMWNFPNCIGAMDGKRFLLTKPSNTGALYYDYKSHHSMIMLALVDANYKFLFVDVGTQGRASDAGVWEKCILREYLEGERLDVPAAASLPYAPSVKTPFVIVGDDAFPAQSVPIHPELLEREDVNQGIIVPGQGRQAAAAFERLQVVGRGHGNEAKAVRDTLKSYFMERGKVSWQEQMALLH
ncbi:hypothetical protein Pmani_025869 [Petrolisthes manimaculis]|uniref:DDE Tnp4 domain-containing protein n=1 Tax=Petrolisthes manimaculis TaxID=1843537 RepID=A0AAE1P7D0_9EUCA|nr:hypothetical protein Pmani_025869 [Petrolisthes manimaculis]